jgi:hypothetical protein
MAVELRSNLGDSDPKETGKLILYCENAYSLKLEALSIFKPLI